MRLKLKEARNNKCMTQREVAAVIGVHVQTYKLIESGKRESKPTVWDKLEELFGIDQRVLREIHK